MTAPPVPDIGSRERDLGTLEARLQTCQCVLRLTVNVVFPSHSEWMVGYSEVGRLRISPSNAYYR
jgi:hypothetical protein